MRVSTYRRYAPLAFLLCASPSLAQNPPAFQAIPAGPQLAPAHLASLRWRNIGPALFGGRITDIDVVRVPGQPDQLYILPEAAGVYRSNNGGTSWTSIFDGVNSLMSMGDLAVAKSNPNVIWLSTGHGNATAYHWGEGVYKSADAGKTWASMGLKETRHIGRMLIHPTNPDIVFAAAAGRLWGPNSERGVFKTTDGGRTWRKVLYVDEMTGASEIVMDPTNPQILLASTHQRQRKGYGGNGLGPGSAVFKSVDGGENWTKITRGLPTVEMGRIGLTISAADPRLIYADIEVGGGAYPFSSADGDCPPQLAPAASTSTGAGRGVGRQVEGQGGVYRSIDGGESWEQGFPRFDTPAGTFLRLWADPKDRNRVYRDGVTFSVSDDMGRTFRTMQTNLHGDYRAFWIDPDNNNHLIISSDGGLGISWDRGLTWDYRNNIPLAQFWELNVDSRDPYLVCGGTQDNGNWCIPSAVRNRNGISNRDAWSVGGGDGMFFQIDPRDTNYAFIEVNSSSTTNSIQRLNLATLQRTNARAGAPRPISCLGGAGARGGQAAVPPRGVGNDPSYRWGWVTPIVFSTVTPGVVYTAANAVFRSTDRGGSWKPISPDLSARVDRDTILIMGKRLGAVNYSPGGGPSMNPNLTSLFGQITWIGESPLNGRVLYSGTDDGQVQVTRDGGVTWTNVTKNIPGLPPFTFVTTVQPSRFVAGRVYATFDGHYNNDESTYVYVSEDYGERWRAITNGLPTTSVVRIAEHPRDANVLALGHMRGVHFSNDGGASWHSLNTNMPTISTRSVVFHPRDNALIVGTYARGIWILDDVGPLQALTAEGLKAEALLVSVTRGKQWSLFSLGPTYGHAEFYGPNPEFDPVMSYYVRDGAAGSATLTITDAQGARVRTLSGPAARGLNRVTWDMRLDPAVPSEGGSGRGGRGGGRGAGAGGGDGPLVLPGKYTVTIAIPGVSRTMRGELAVVGDPLDTSTPAERSVRQEALLRAYGLQKTLVTARTAVRALIEQAPAIKQDLTRGGSAAAASADSIAARLARVQAEVDRLAGIAGTVLRAIEGFNTPPTADQRQQLGWATDDAMRAIALINRTSQTEIPALYAQHARGTAPRVVGPVATPAAPVVRRP